MSPSSLGALKGYLCVVIGAMMWASSGTAGKALFEGGVNALDLVQIRVTLASLILFLFLALFSRSSLRIRPRDVGYFLLLGGVFMALVQGTYFYTISKIQVAAAILIQYLAPIFVAVYSMVFWKEHPSFFKISALVLAFGGCYLVVGGYNLDLLRMNRLGIMGGVACAICFAGYSLLGERGMHRYKPWTVLFYALVFAIRHPHMGHPTSDFPESDPGFQCFPMRVNDLHRRGRHDPALRAFFLGHQLHPLDEGERHGDPRTHPRSAENSKQRLRPSAMKTPSAGHFDHEHP